MRPSRKRFVHVLFAFCCAGVALMARPFVSGLPDGCVDVAFAEVTQAAQKLTASDGAAADQFGYTVAISGDTALVGAIDDDDRGTDAGAVYVFVRSGGVWTQQQKLTASDGAGAALFGWSIALSGDTALVGSPFADDNRGTDCGSAYVFVRSGGVWSQQQKLTPAAFWLPVDRFGFSVAIEGDTALIGTRPDATTRPGSVYVFARSESGFWGQSQNLTAPSSNFVYENFGSSVALSGDTALIGSPHGQWGTLQRGAVYVISRSSGPWTLRQTLTSNDWDFGSAATLSGHTALIGTRDLFMANGGHVFVFADSGGTWAQTQELKASGGPASENFGVCFALSGDVALVGSNFDSEKGALTGAVYVFAWSGSAWSQQQKLTAADAAAYDKFGGAVALYGETALIGAAGDDDKGNQSGSAYVLRVDVNAPPAAAKLAPASLAFGQTPVGQPSMAQIATLTNTGGRDLHVASTLVSGANAGEFEVAPGGATPAPSLTPTVGPGASVTFAVTFTPQAPGGRVAELQITTDDPVTPIARIAISGEGPPCVTSPGAGTIGTIVTVTGAGFGPKKGKLLVFSELESAALKVTRWNAHDDGVVEGVVVKAVPPGRYQLCVAPRRAEPIYDLSPFTIVAPAIVDATPASGPGGATVVLTCTSLGTAKGSVFLQAPGATKRIKCKVTSWPRDAASGTGQGEVRIRVPKKLAGGTAYDIVLKNRIGEATAVGAFTAEP